MKRIPTIFLFLLYFSNIYSLKNIIDEGLSYQIFQASQKSIIGNSEITIIKINPKFYDINILSSDIYSHGNLTIKEWVKTHGLTVAVNAGMFQSDYSSNAGYMKQGEYINNPYINHYQSIAAFNPKNSSMPKFKIFDVEKINGILNKDKIRDVINNYETVVQNLRLIKRPQENRWPQQFKIWSEVAMGEDNEGNILLIFSRSPYSMHDLNEILLDLPIEIQCAQHLEGGPEASLYLKSDGVKLGYSGSYESNFFEDNSNTTFWKIPNIIGITKKK